MKQKTQLGRLCHNDDAQRSKPMQCVNCGFENIPGMQQCVRCQSSLALGTVEVIPPRAGRYRSASRWRRLWNWMDWSVRHWPEHVPRWRPRLNLLEHVPWEAVALSALLPGLGQIRYGTRWTGWTLLTAWLACLVPAVAFYGTEVSPLLFGGAMSVHAAAILALMGADLAEKGLLGRMVYGAVVFAGIGLLVYWPLQWLGGQFYTPLHVAGIQAQLGVHHGDVVWYQGPWRRSWTFQRGDIVLYTINGGAVAGHAYIGNGYGLDRILGVPGDRVTLRKNEVLVNGLPVPWEHQPLGVLPRLGDIELTAGYNEYVILPTTLPMQMHGNVQAIPILVAVSRVKETDIIGRIVFRTSPWSRWGPIQ
jgi:hypothetical protein